MAQTKKTEFQFAKALETLEKTVNEMEQGDLSLEEALKKFEQGVKLTRQCQQSLQEAEQKVQMIIDENPNSQPQEFKQE